MRFVPKHLALRLILTLTLLVAVVQGIFAYINVHNQERDLLDGMVRGADQLSRSITNATWHAMLADHRDDVYQILHAIGQEPGIESIRIFNKEGRVTYSTDPHAPQQVDKNAERSRSARLARATAHRVYSGVEQRSSAAEMSALGILR